MIGSVAYVGTQTTHQLADYDINSGVPGSTNANLPLANYGRTAALDMWSGYLSSHYHSLQTSVNKQVTHGLFIKAAYTWSKAIDYTDDDGWATPSRMYGFQWNRAVAGYDRTHVFQAGWVYELPVGKGKAYVNSGTASHILGNWKVNGSLSAFTGVPFNVTASGTSVAAARQHSDCRPGEDKCPAHRRHWFRPAVLRPHRLRRRDRRSFWNQRPQRPSRTRYIQLGSQVCSVISRSRNVYIWNSGRIASI